MNKNFLAGCAMALAVLATGAVPALAAGHAHCPDSQTVRQFIQATKGLAAELKARDLELREVHAYDRVDIHKVRALETEIRELKEQINAQAKSYGLPECCRS